MIDNRYVWEEQDIIIVDESGKVVNYNPRQPRDSRGRWTSMGGGVSTPGLNAIYEKYPKLKNYAKPLANKLQAYRKIKDELDNTPQGVDRWWEKLSEHNRVQGDLRTSVDAALADIKADRFIIDNLQNEWSGGNGPRNKKGDYLSLPDLELEKTNPNILKMAALTQAVLYESGVSELTLYRGQEKSKSTPTGLTSFTTSKAIAGNFGWETKWTVEKSPTTGKEVKVPEQIAPNVITKTVPVSAINTHYEIYFESQHPTEQEVIIDMDKL